MADQIYEQQQKEREDREFELLKRKHEQEEMERKAYLAPFETKETLAQYEDAANERQGKKNQQLAWMSPYRPSVEVADDGTRKVGAEMPTSLVLENLIAAAGPGFQSDYITPFAKAAPDAIGKATLDVKETPEEAKSRIEAETEHKRALELAGARKAEPRPPRATTPKQTPQEKAADAFFKQVLDLYKKEFIAKFERAPDDNEWAQLYQKAVAAKNKTFAQPAATTPTQKPAPNPAASKKASTSPTPDDDPFETFEKDPIVQKVAPSAVAPTPAAAPVTNTVNLKEKQAAAPTAMPANDSYIQPYSGNSAAPDYSVQVESMIRNNWDRVAQAQGFRPEDQQELLQIVNSLVSTPEGIARFKKADFEARGSIQKPALLLMLAKAELDRRRAQSAQQAELSRRIRQPSFGNSL